MCYYFNVNVNLQLNYCRSTIVSLSIITVAHECQVENALLFLSEKGPLSDFL